MGIFNLVNAQWTSTSGPGLNGIVKIAAKGTDIYATSLESGVRVLRGGEIPWVGSNFSKTSYGICITGEDIYVGTTMEGIFKSSDNGLSWTAKNAGIPYLGGMMDFAVKGTDLYTASFISGVIKSTDNGENWTPMNDGLNGYTDINAILISGENIWIGSNGGGASLSTDNGTTWTPKNTGMPVTKRVRSLAVSGTIILAGTYSGVFMTKDNGDNWTALNTGLTDLHITSLVTNGTIIFAGTAGGGVFKTDLSKDTPTWATINTGLTSASISALNIIGNDLYAAVQESSTTNIWKRPISQGTAITNVTADNGIVVYPTVATDEITIEATNQNGGQKFTIENLIGQTVYSATFNKKTTVNVSDFKSGTYLINLTVGKSATTKKFIKQ